MKTPPCRCDAVRFPHRPGSVALCDANQDEREQLVSQPGREHFDSDAEYWREALRSL